MADTFGLPSDVFDEFVRSQIFPERFAPPLPGGLAARFPQATAGGRGRPSSEIFGTRDLRAQGDPRRGIPTSDFLRGLAPGIKPPSIVTDEARRQGGTRIASGTDLIAGPLGARGGRFISPTARAVAGVGRGGLPGDREAGQRALLAQFGGAAGFNKALNESVRRGIPTSEFLRGLSPSGTAGAGINNLAASFNTEGVAGETGDLSRLAQLIDLARGGISSRGFGSGSDLPTSLRSGVSTTAPRRLAPVSFETRSGTRSAPPGRPGLPRFTAANTMPFATPQRQFANPPIRPPAPPAPAAPAAPAVPFGGQRRSRQRPEFRGQAAGAR